MLFKERHIEMIRTGTKIASRRKWKRPCAKVGGTYPVQTKMFQPRKECHIIRCLKLYQQPLGEMTEEDADKEGGYTLEQFKNIWEEIVGTWNPELVVYVVEFEYVSGPKEQTKF